MENFNKNSLKSAVGKYGTLHTVDKKSEEEIKKALEQDERKFTDSQITEIYEAILDPSKLEPEKPKSEKPAKHIVIVPFRDINDFSKTIEIGEDVSGFDEVRLATLVENKLVEKVVED